MQQRFHLAVEPQQGIHLHLLAHGLSQVEPGRDPFPDAGVLRFLRGGRHPGPHRVEIHIGHATEQRRSTSSSVHRSACVGSSLITRW
jgi:hypothetical protein